MGTPHLSREGQASLHPGTPVVLSLSISCPRLAGFSSPPADLKPKSIAIAPALGRQGLASHPGQGSRGLAAFLLLLLSLHFSSNP